MSSDSHDAPLLLDTQTSSSNNTPSSLFAGLPTPTSSPMNDTPLLANNNHSSPIPTAVRASTLAAPSPASFSPRGKYKLQWYGFLFFSIFLLVLLPLFVNWKIRQGVIDQIVMDSPRAQGYAMFRNRSSQGGTVMRYTFFNITNPHQVLRGEERPHLEELGPFIYKQTQLRDDLQFDYERDLLSFRQQVYQTFDPEATRIATGGRFDRDDIPFCTINILFFGMSSVVGNEAWHLINEITLWNTDFKRLFEFKTVYEMVEGYTVPLKIGNRLSIPISFPGLVPSHRNPEDDYEYKYVNKIFMGRKNLTLTNSLHEWGEGGRETLVPCPWGNNPLSSDCSKFRNNPCCGFGLKVKPWGQEYIPGLWNANANEVQGTLGDAFRPYLKRREEEKVTVWSDQLYRALQFSNRNRVAVNLQGIHMLRFTATREFWSNATVHPPNARFYQFGPDGLVNASILYLGAPIFISLPHFLDSQSEFLHQGVTGLSPDPELHSMFIDIEPTTGMTFREHNRIQINVRIQGNVGGWFPHVKECYVPVGYFDAHSEINHVGVKEFLELYNGLSILYGAMAIGTVSLALVLIGSPIYSWFKTHHRKTKSQRHLLRERSLRSVIVLEE